MYKIQIFRLTFSEKSPSGGGSPPPAPLNLQFWWPKVAWFTQIVDFQTDYDEIEFLKKISSDVIVITLAKNVTILKSQYISIFAPSQTKFLAALKGVARGGPDPNRNVTSHYKELIRTSFRFLRWSLAEIRLKCILGFPLPGIGQIVDFQNDYGKTKN